MNRPETNTLVFYVVQSSITFGLEWEPWKDAGGPETFDEDLYSVIGKCELFHYFMTHGCYPEPFASSPTAVLLQPLMTEMRNEVLLHKAEQPHKFRTRIVRRTIVSTITDEEVDPAAVVKHGEKA